MLYIGPQGILTTKTLVSYMSISINIEGQKCLVGLDLDFSQVPEEHCIFLL